VARSLRNTRLAKRVQSMSRRRKAAYASAIAVVAAAGITAVTIGSSGAYLGDVKQVILKGTNPTVHGTVTDAAGNPVSSVDFGNLAPGVPQTSVMKLHVTGSLDANTYVVFDPQALNDGHGAGLNTFGTYAIFTVTLDGGTVFRTTNANDAASCPPGSTSATHPEPCHAIDQVLDLGKLRSGSTHTLRFTFEYPSKMTAQGATPTAWNRFVDLDKNGNAFPNADLPMNVDYQQVQAPAPTVYVPPTPAQP